MRTIRKIYNAPAKHWVGNGFYVSPLFSHMGEDKQTSPFLMFDYAMPHTFAPNSGAPPYISGSMRCLSVWRAPFNNSAPNMRTGWRKNSFFIQ